MLTYLHAESEIHCNCWQTSFYSGADTRQKAQINFNYVFFLMFIMFLLILKILDNFNLTGLTLRLESPVEL